MFGFDEKEVEDLYRPSVVLRTKLTAIIGVERVQGNFEFVKNMFSLDDDKNVSRLTAPDTGAKTISEIISTFKKYQSKKPFAIYDKEDNLIAAVKCFNELHHEWLGVVYYARTNKLHIKYESFGFTKSDNIYGIDIDVFKDVPRYEFGTYHSEFVSFADGVPDFNLTAEKYVCDMTYKQIVNFITGQILYPTDTVQLSLYVQFKTSEVLDVIFKKYIGIKEEFEKAKDAFSSINKILDKEK